jgi:PAS domain S-box-containing protein
MKKSNQPVSASLRVKAEELLHKKLSKSGPPLSEVDTLKLLHELEVHQIELEMQKEELMIAGELANNSLQKYTELYDFAPSGYFTLSRDGKIVKLNLAGAQMLGKERSHLIDSSFGFFVPNDSKPVFNQFLKNVFKGKVKETCELSLSDNGIPQVFVQLTGIAAEDKEHCLVTMVDFTERRKAEEKILKIGQHFKAITENASDGIVLINKAGKFRFVSHSSRNIFGYNATEAITDDPAEFTHPEDLPMVLTELDKLVRNPSYVATLQYRFADKNGNWKWIESVFTNMFENPDVESIVINFREITERKIAEDELNKKTEDLMAMNNYFIDREYKMIELKKEVNELLLKSGGEEKYVIHNE